MPETPKFVTKNDFLLKSIVHTRHFFAAKHEKPQLAINRAEYLHEVLDDSDADGRTQLAY